LPRGACPEQNEILRYAQNDKKRRARKDTKSYQALVFMYNHYRFTARTL